MRNKYNTNGYGSIVDAIYTEPKCSIDKDNILITALPEPLVEKSDLFMNYTRGLPSYSSSQNTYRKKVSCTSTTQCQNFSAFRGVSGDRIL